MADNINKDSIDDIVSNVRKTLESGEVSDGGVLFEFVDDESEESATFVFGEPVQQEEAAASAEPIEEPKSEPKSEQKPEPKPETVGEFEIQPEKQENEAPALAGIWTTYVPRFTEVSENYRMKSSSEQEKPQPAQPKMPKESPILIPEQAESSPVDPTAELESESSLSGATVVTSGNSSYETGEDTSTVFKFNTESAPAEQSEPLPEAELPEEPAPEKEEPENEPLPIEETFAEEETEEEEESYEPAAEENKPYVMPDPDVEAVEPGVNLPAEKTVAALETVDEAVARRKRSEYSSFSEKDGFLDNFIDTIMSVRVRIASALFLTLILLFLENASFLGFNVIRFMHFEGIGGAMAIITLPFIAGIFLLSLPEVIYSFTALAKKKLVPEIFITVSAAVLVIYYTLIIVFASKEDYFLFGFLFALLTLISMFSSYYKKKADFEAFKIVSAKGEKKVVDRKLTRNLPAEHRALDGKIESYKSRTARVFNTNFVSDFSARSSIISENTAGNLIILAVSLGVAIVGGIVAFFIPGGIVRAAMTFAAVYMISLPVFVIAAHKIPFYQATAEASREKSAVIGEKTLYDYSGIDVITFDDTEIFGKEDVNLQRIMMYGRKENLPKALQQMSALFTVVGGPLAYIFANAVDRRVSPADNVAVDTDGVIGSIDGVEIMAGSAAFMESRGIEIPYDPEGDGQASQTTRIMYAAEDGVIYAKFYVRYMLSEEFTMILPIMLDDGVKPLVYTRDPNIDDGLFRSLTAGTDSIRVLKKQNLPSSEVRLYSRISLGMVTLGDKTNVINTILLSKKYAAFQTRFALTELPALIAGAMLGLLLAICSKSMISSLLLSLWYVGWTLAILLIGKKNFGSKKEKTKEKEDD